MHCAVQQQCLAMRAVRGARLAAAGHEGIWTDSVARWLRRGVQCAGGAWPNVQAGQTCPGHCSEKLRAVDKAPVDFFFKKRHVEKLPIWIK